MSNENESIIVTLCYNLTFKVKEGTFFYKKIEKSATSNDAYDEVNYYFGAFINTIQAVKDIMDEILIFQEKEKITWETFGKDIAYFSFIKDARNATTHNGYQLINSWVNGKYYFGNDIFRLSYGKIVKIKVPEAELTTVCLNFFKNFLLKISDFSKKNKDIFLITTSQSEINELTSNSHIVPSWVKQNLNNINLNDLLIKLPSSYEKIIKTCLESLESLDKAK